MLTEQRTEQSKLAADQPTPNQRQAGKGNQSWKGQSRPQRGIRAKCKQTSLLAKTSWVSGQSTSAGRVAARDQLPRRDTMHTREDMPIAHPETRAAGTGEAIG